MSFIIKIPHDGIDYFMEWSTVSDSLSTYGMPFDEFKA